MAEAESGRYTFVVARGATKEEIKKILKKVYNVNVAAVSTYIVKGKRQRIGKRRTEVAGAVWKKAMVTLKKGETISFFEAESKDYKKKKK
jgi:large subunit ribosomal protein L23